MTTNVSSLALVGVLWATTASAAPPGYDIIDFTDWTPGQLATLPFFKHYTALPTPNAPADFHLVDRTAAGVHVGNVWVVGDINSTATMVGPTGITSIPPFGTFFWWKCCPYASKDIQVSTAYDVNYAGTVVGQANLGGTGQNSGDQPDHHGFAFDTNGGMVDLTPGAKLGAIRGINNRGDVTGYAYNGGSINAPFRRSVDGTLTPLNAIPPGYNPEPRWINANGVIIGSSIPGAFVASAGSTTMKLGTIVGMPLSIASDLNDAGWIVGDSESWDHSERYATIWEPDAGSGTWIPHDLTDVVNAEGILLDAGVAINNDGHIICVGHLDGGSFYRMYLLTPQGTGTNSCVPDIGLHPVDATACCGAPTPMSVKVVGGTVPMLYEWQVEASPSAWITLSTAPTALPCGGWASATPANAADTTIDLSACVGVDAYPIRCVVSNACGSVVSNAATVSVVAGCYADCDASGQLAIDDFICFQTLFAIGDPGADCDASGVLSIDDFICFQTLFAIGC